MSVAIGSKEVDIHDERAGEIATRIGVKKDNVNISESESFLPANTENCIGRFTRLGDIGRK